MQLRTHPHTYTTRLPAKRAPYLRPKSPPPLHLLTLFTYALAGDTRQHCHRLQPLRERAEHADRPCGCWVNSSPSSAPSADAPLGAMLEIQLLIHPCAWSFQAVLLILIGPLWTDEYEYELLPQAQLPRRLPRRRSRRAAGLRRASRCLGAHGACCGPGSRPRQQGKGRRRAPMAASLGETAAGAAPGSGLMEAGPLAARIGRAGPRGALDRSRPL